MQTQVTKCPISRVNQQATNIVQFIRCKLQIKYPDGKLKRAFHAKSIGLVQAELEVKKELPNELRVGIFSEEASYPAWIRFTNGSATVSPDDLTKGMFGMAIKVKGISSVDGPKDQDIILLTSPIFVPGTCPWQLNGVKSVLGNALTKLANIALLLILFPMKGFKFLGNRIKTPNVLEETYYSCTPYGFGDNHAIKWRARPLKTITSSMPDQPQYDFLSKRLAEDLSESGKEPIAFELAVQFQETETTEPIDDTSVEWKTIFHPIAILKISKQNPDTPARKEEDQKTSFSPGNAIREHRPLGSVNLIRAQVYKTLAKDRIEHL